MGDRLRVDVDGGKYTVIQPESGGAYVLRYGELWLDELPEGAIRSRIPSRAVG